MVKFKLGHTGIKEETTYGGKMKLEEEKLILFEGKFKDGDVIIKGKGATYDVIINGKSLDRVMAVDINFSPRCLPVITIRKVILNE